MEDYPDQSHFVLLNCCGLRSPTPHRSRPATRRPTSALIDQQKRRSCVSRSAPPDHNIRNVRFVQHEPTSLIRQASNLAAEVHNRNQRWGVLTQNKCKSMLPVEGTSVSNASTGTVSQSRLSVFTRDWESVKPVIDPESPMGGVYIGEYPECQQSYGSFRARKKISAPAFGSRKAESGSAKRRACSEYGRRRFQVGPGNVDRGSRKLSMIPDK